MLDVGRKQLAGGYLQLAVDRKLLAGGYLQLAVGRKLLAGGLWTFAELRASMSQRLVLISQRKHPEVQEYQFEI